jgi:micrococcal nuclease
MGKEKVMAIVLVICAGVMHGQEIYRVNVNHISHSYEVDVSKLLKVFVGLVIDGDTAEVHIKNPPENFGMRERVRFLGVDTPETVNPRKGKEYYGEEAGMFTRDVIEGKHVYLAFDWDLRDRYGRLLAYVYLENGDCLNVLLLKKGFAHAYIRYPFQFMKEFERYEKGAGKTKVGLWGKRKDGS